MQDPQNADSMAAANEFDPTAFDGRRGSPLSHVLRTFTRTGGFYARSWGNYLDREPGELPVARPTIALATHAFRDEIVLAGFRLQRSAPDAKALERVNNEVAAALQFYGHKGWLEQPEGFFAAPPPLTDVEVRPVNSMGRRYERIVFDSDYEPHVGEPGSERWLSYTANNREYALLLRHRKPRPWVVCVHGAVMGRAAMDLTLFRAWHLYRDLGLNVVLPVLPQHGPRGRGLPAGGAFPSGDLLNDVHMVAQGVWDIRRLLSWIRSQQPDAKIGLNGLSLGGLLTSLVRQPRRRTHLCDSGCPGRRSLRTAGPPRRPAPRRPRPADAGAGPAHQSDDLAAGDDAARADAGPLRLCRRG